MPDWLVKAVEADKVMVHEAKVVTLIGDRGISTALPGDWFVHTHKGEIYAVPKQLFELSHEKVSP